MQIFGQKKRKKLDGLCKMLNLLRPWVYMQEHYIFAFLHHDNFFFFLQIWCLRYSANSKEGQFYSFSNKQNGFQLLMQLANTMYHKNSVVMFVRMRPVYAYVQ